MRRVLMGLAVIAGACGSTSTDTSVCDSLATAASDLATKAAPCTSTTPPLALTADSCRSSISKCSTSDQQAIKAYASCLEALPTCSPPSSGSWQVSLGDCAAQLGPLAGQGC